MAMTFFHRIIFSLEEKETIRLQSKISIYDFCMHVKKAGKNILTNQRIKDFSIPKGTPIAPKCMYWQLNYEGYCYTISHLSAGVMRPKYKMVSFLVKNWPKVSFYALRILYLRQTFIHYKAIYDILMWAVFTDLLNGVSHTVLSLQFKIFTQPRRNPIRYRNKETKISLPGGELPQRVQQELLHWV